jgi:hypothetical protein
MQSSSPKRRLHLRSLRLAVVAVAVAAGLALGPAQSSAATGERTAVATGATLGTWNDEGAQRAAEEAPRLEAEREAKRKAEEERPANEAAEKAAHDREVREAGERAGREAAERAAREASERAAGSHAARCVVPRLRGDSLTAARRALYRLHCALGSVTMPRARHGALVVAGQSVRAGRELAGEAKVAIVLAPPKRR